MTSGAIKVLGIDPGLTVTGYGLVLAEGNHYRTLGFGHVAPPTKAPQAERLLRIHEAVSDFIREMQPDEVAVEDFIVGHVRAAVAVGEARAAAVLAAAQAGLAVSFYKPLEVKRFVTSYGRGSKEQVAMMVQALLGAGGAAAAGGRGGRAGGGALSLLAKEFSDSCRERRTALIARFAARFSTGDGPPDRGRGRRRIPGIRNGGNDCGREDGRRDYAAHSHGGTRGIHDAVRVSGRTPAAALPDVAGREGWGRRWGSELLSIMSTDDLAFAIASGECGGAGTPGWARSWQAGLSWNCGARWPQAQRRQCLGWSRRRSWRR